MKRLIVYFVIVFFILFGGTTMSQGQTPKDSLEELLPKAEGVDRLKVIDRLLVYTIYNDLDTSYYYAMELLNSAKELQEVKYESLAYSWLTVYSFFRGEYYKGEDYIKKAIRIQEKIHDTLDLGNSYINLVMIYAETGRYKKAIESSFKALSLFKAINDQHGIIAATGNIGIMYNKIQDYASAVKYLKKTSALMIKYEEFTNLGELYNNMGLSYYHMGKSDSALAYYNKAIRNYNSNKELKGTARAYLNMANVYAYSLKNYDSAFYYYRKSLKTSEGVIDGLKSKIYGNQGKVYAMKGDYRNAIKYINLALDISRQNKELTEQMDDYFELFNIYKKKKDYLKALEYYEKYNAVKDSIDVANAKVTIADLEAKFENEKNKLLIKQLEEKRVSDHRIKILLMAGLVLLIVVLILTVYGFVQKRKKGKLQRALLETEKEQLENDLQYKSRQLTSQALMMMQKNKLLNEILQVLSGIKEIPDESKQELNHLKRQLKKGIHSEEDWGLFKHYFEEVNPDFFPNILGINNKITPAELKLAALIKLKFNIKETASLLNISPDSVKSTRYVLRRKLGLQKGDSIYDFLNQF
jgi:tetratricopeptide (TPR) repeat protein